jgi:hypothetical protein
MVRAHWFIYAVIGWTVVLVGAFGETFGLWQDARLLVLGMALAVGIALWAELRARRERHLLIEDRYWESWATPTEEEMRDGWQNR